MNYNKKIIFKITDSILLLSLVAVIVYQFYVTFQTKTNIFENPKAYIDANYKKDFITSYDEHFTELKKAFEKPTVIAYIGEENEEQTSFLTNYFLTQYCLTPNLLVKNNKLCDTVLYNIHSTLQLNMATNFHINNGWHIVKDFNNGLILLAK